MSDNSCLTCVVASDDNKMNGYLDLICNIWYLHRNLTPFEKRCNEICGYTNADEVEAKYPCPFHMTLDEYIAMKSGK